MRIRYVFYRGVTVFIFLFFFLSLLSSFYRLMINRTRSPVLKIRSWAVKKNRPLGSFIFENDFLVTDVSSNLARLERHCLINRNLTILITILLPVRLFLTPFRRRKHVDEISFYNFSLRQTWKSYLQSWWIMIPTLWNFNFLSGAAWINSPSNVLYIKMYILFELSKSIFKRALDLSFQKNGEWRFHSERERKEEVVDVNSFC